MRTTDLSVNFVGFEPAEEVLTRLYQTLDDLLEEAPAGAFIKATFSRQDGGNYQGALRVNSFVGPFSVTSIGQDIAELLLNLNRDMHAKLDKWKFRRFIAPASTSQFITGYL